MTTGPLALLSRGYLLVPRTLRDDLALELRERQQDIQCQAPQGRIRIELLRDGDEADTILLEQLHHPGEINQRAAEAIHFVDQHAVDQSGLDVG
jgi:hypothetical protein